MCVNIICYYTSYIFSILNRILLFYGARTPLPTNTVNSHIYLLSDSIYSLINKVNIEEK